MSLYTFVERQRANIHFIIAVMGAEKEAIYSIFKQNLFAK